MSASSAAASGLVDPGRKRRKLGKSLDGAIIMVVTCISLIAVLVGTAIAGSAQPGVSAGASTVESLELAVEAEPGRADLLLALGTMYMTAAPTDIEAAVAVLERAVAVDPENAEAYLKLGTAQMMLGHSKTASEVLAEYGRLR
jgi:Tfp pilus assembly protein PilF